MAFLGKHANPDPTQRRHIQLSVQPNLLTGFTTSESTPSNSVSSCHTEAISCCTRAAGPMPPGLLLTNMAFMTAFHLSSSLICLSMALACFYSHLCSLNGPLAPVANTLSSQSGDNDCHLDLCLIKSLPVGSKSTPLFSTAKRLPRDFT